MDKQRNRMRSLVGLAFIILFIEQLVNAQQHIHIYQFLTIVTVPTIFFAVGYFIDVAGSFKSFLVNGLKKFVVPYVVTGIAVIVLNILAGHLTWLNRPFIDTKTIIKTFGYGIGWPTDTLLGQSSFGVGLVWLLLAIFWATLIFKALTKFKKRWLIITAIILVTAAGYWFRTLVQLPWSFEAAMIAQPFIYFGFLIKERENMPMSIAAFFVGIIFWFISGVSGAFDFTVAYNFHPIFGTVASLFAVSVIYICHNKFIYPIKPVKVVLTYLGNHLVLDIIIATLVLDFTQGVGKIAIFYKLLILMIGIIVMTVLLKRLARLIKKDEKMVKR
ncbi:hypothetical protein [Weissella bombi]|uniref:Fucose 4-O-acetylase n=1 Tax=Weissella bombi TaxID=1505725 RepID=A0A1C3Z6Q7_9LACO|nr:hypothetical protein [Weissella bombi]SCB77948.1 Fucose 4-O-acetylase [Weissella bombi]